MRLRGSEINKCPNCAGFLFAFEAQKRRTKKLLYPLGTSKLDVYLLRIP